MKNLKGIVIGLVVVVVVGIGLILGLRQNSAAPVNAGGVVQNTNNQYTAGIALGNTPVTMSWDTVKITKGLNKASWRNTTGKTVYATLVESSFVPQTGSTTVTSSSTYSLYAYASTTNVSSTYDFTAPAQTNINGTVIAINNFSLATSSTATTTSSLDKAFAGKVIAIPNLGYLNFVFQGQNATCSSSVATNCVTATSSTRGFDVLNRINYHD